MGRLDGVTAVVTGAARGLGHAVAQGFAREQATLHLCDRITSPEPDIDGATWHDVDLRDRAACRRFVSDVLERSGAIDVLVNNAAVLPFATLNATTDDAWDETLTVNLTAPFLLVQGFLPSMKARGGSIINVSSRAGVLGFENEVAYCASKFGIEGLTKALAAELSGVPVSVNTMTPGLHIKPTMMTLAEESRLPLEEKPWSSADALVPAFVHLALARGEPTGQRFDAKQLTEALKK